jgi:hypothetical protein
MHVLKAWMKPPYVLEQEKNCRIRPCAAGIRRTFELSGIFVILL